MAVGDSLTLHAPAKLNLWLRLTGTRRADGRHELESHFTPLALADRLVLRPAAAFSIHIEGPFAAGVPRDASNLLWQTYTQFCQAFGPCPPLAITLTKAIPSGAGLGGGSGDAGALLAHLAGERGIPMASLAKLALQLGADVPAALGPHSGLVSGVGEILGEPLPLPTRRRVLLVKPAEPCKTGAVFRALAQAPALTRQAAVVSQNDLEAAAVSVTPAVGDVLGILRKEVAPDAQITGSGSTCFALLEEGQMLSQRAQDDLRPYWCLESRLSLPAPRIWA